MLTTGGAHSQAGCGQHDRREGDAVAVDGSRRFHAHDLEGEEILRLSIQALEAIRVLLELTSSENAPVDEI